MGHCAAPLGGMRQGLKPPPGAKSLRARRPRFNSGKIILDKALFRKRLFPLTLKARRARAADAIPAKPNGRPARQLVYLT